jgi:hypothetical protein
MAHRAWARDVRVSSDTLGLLAAITMIWPTAAISSRIFPSYLVGHVYGRSVVDPCTAGRRTRYAYAKRLTLRVTRKVLVVFYAIRGKVKGKGLTCGQTRTGVAPVA